MLAGLLLCGNAWSATLERPDATMRQALISAINSSDVWDRAWKTRKNA